MIIGMSMSLSKEKN